MPLFNPTSSTANSIKQRVAAQVNAAFRAGDYGPNLKLDFGYGKKMREAVGDDGAVRFFETMGRLAEELTQVPFDTAGEFMTVFGNMVDLQVKEVARA